MVAREIEELGARSAQCVAALCSDDCTVNSSCTGLTVCLFQRSPLFACLLLLVAVFLDTPLDVRSNALAALHFLRSSFRDTLSMRTRVPHLHMTLVFRYLDFCLPRQYLL